jgi:DNA-binding GntR family transcriptional regulator
MNTSAERGARARPAPRPVGEAVATTPEVEDRIWQAVFDGVMSRRLAPGTRLPEQGLCRLFGVSRAMVRKVLQRLANDKIVELRPNRGAVVARPSREEAQQLFEARRAVEAAIVRLVAERATPADLQALRRQLACEHAVMHRQDQSTWSRLASAYHLRLAELSGNPILQRYLTEIVSRCALLVAVYQPPGNAVCEHHEHERVVDCIARGDADAAVHLMESHLLALEGHLMIEPPVPQKGLAFLLGLEAPGGGA